MLATQASDPIEDNLQQVTRLLGGSRLLARDPSTALEAHDLILAGLPGASLIYFIDHLIVLRHSSDLERAMGMSVRTLQRRKDAPSRTLTQEQSGRTWKFAEIPAKAINTFGSQEKAEQWLRQSAIGLDQRRPIDLLSTPAGIELIEDLLGRIDHGVYA